MTGHRPFSELAAKVMADPNRRARVEAYGDAMRAMLELAERRASAGVAWDEIEQAIEASSANETSDERRHGVYLSTLRRYVEALGGRIEINAVFPDETVPLLVPGENARPVPAAPSRSS